MKPRSKKLPTVMRTYLTVADGDVFFAPDPHEAELALREHMVHGLAWGDDTPCSTTDTLLWEVGVVIPFGTSDSPVCPPGWKLMATYTLHLRRNNGECAPLSDVIVYEMERTLP